MSKINLKVVEAPLMPFKNEYIPKLGNICLALS